MDRKQLLETPITTPAAAVAFIRGLDALGLLFHFDDSPETVECGYTGRRLFSDDEAAEVEARVAECFELLDDPHAVCVGIGLEVGQRVESDGRDAGTLVGEIIAIEGDAATVRWLSGHTTTESLFELSAA